MKKLRIYTIILIHLFLLSSCELSDIDNYDGPNATINGGIYDHETGELVQQDIVNGMQLEYTEHGFDNPQIQYMVVKNDGTYRNNLMFAGVYTIRPVRGNFVPVESEEITVIDNTVKDFKVQPYIRIHDASIQKEGNKIVARFRLEQTVTNNVSRIALFAHEEPNVGSTLNTFSAGIDINGVIDDAQEYSLEINLDGNAALVAGQQYYFRIGALIAAPEARYNYAPAIRITI